MSRFPKKLPVRLFPLLLLAMATAVAQLFAHDGHRVASGGWQLPHLCPARRLGDECLGCGATRASLDLLQGDWAAAWSLQPFVFLLPLVFVVEAFSPSLGPQRTRKVRVGLAMAIVLTAVLPRAI